MVNQQAIAAYLSNVKRRRRRLAGDGVVDPDAALKAWIGAYPYADYHARKMLLDMGGRGFQESTGPTPVTASADKIGLALDGAQWGGTTLAELIASQPELFPDPSFNNAALYILATGMTISGGKASLAAVASAQQASYTDGFPGTEDNAFYRYLARVSGYSAGSLAGRVRGGSTANMGVNGNGDWSQIIQAGTSGIASNTAALCAQGTTTLDVDEISLKNIPGFHGLNASSSQRLNMLVAPLYDQAKIDAMPEKAINGDFASDSAWSKGSGITISGGALNFSAAVGGQGATQSCALVAGKSYRCSGVMSGYSSGQLYFRLRQAGGNIEFRPVAANGPFSFVMVAPVGVNSIELISSGNGGNGTFSLDNVSIKEVPADAISDRYTMTGDGTDDNLLTTWLAASGGNTIFFDVDIPATLSSVRVAFGTQIGGGGRLEIAFNTNGRLWGGVGSQTGTIISGTTDWRGLRCVGAITHDGSTVRVFTIEGGQEYSGAQSGNPNTTNPARLGADNNNTVSLANFAGGIARIVPVQKGGLTLTDWQTIGPAFAAAS